MIQLREEFHNSPVAVCTRLGMSYAGFAAAGEADPEGKRWGSPATDILLLESRPWLELGPEWTLDILSLVIPH